MPAAALSLLGCTNVSAVNPQGPALALERTLDGRIAGEPVDCIRLGDHLDTEIVQGTAIVWNEGQTLYVNRPRAGAESLDRSATLVTRALGPRLCTGDTVSLIDSLSGMTTSVVRLGPFVPYRRSGQGGR
jgi:hypothetical protein